MLQLNNNIKLIRELTGKKQGDFAKLIKTNLSNLKTYENSSVRPKANVLAAICDIAGISLSELENKALTHKDVHIGELAVEKVDTRQTAAFGAGDPTILPGSATLQDLIKAKDQAIKDAKEYAAKMEEHYKDVLARLTKEQENVTQAQETIRTNLQKMESNLTRGQHEIKEVVNAVGIKLESMIEDTQKLVSKKKASLSKDKGLTDQVAPVDGKDKKS